MQKKEAQWQQKCVLVQTLLNKPSRLLVGIQGGVGPVPGMGTVRAAAGPPVFVHDLARNS